MKDQQKEPLKDEHQVKPLPTTVMPGDTIGTPILWMLRFKTWGNNLTATAVSLLVFGFLSVYWDDSIFFFSDAALNTEEKNVRLLIL